MAWVLRSLQIELQISLIAQPQCDPGRRNWNKSSSALWIEWRAARRIAVRTRAPAADGDCLARQCQKRRWLCFVGRRVSPTFDQNGEGDLRCMEDRSKMRDIAFCVGEGLLLNIINTWKSFFGRSTSCNGDSSIIIISNLQPILVLLRYMDEWMDGWRAGRPKEESNILSHIVLPHLSLRKTIIIFVLLNLVYNFVFL